MLRRALEAHYALIGQLLVRGTVPPQQLDDEITLKLILTPGSVERIDATAFPVRLVRVSSPLLQKLFGDPRVMLADPRVMLAASGRALLSAGYLPWLRPRLTLALGVADRRDGAGARRCAAVDAHTIVARQRPVRKPQPVWRGTGLYVQLSARAGRHAVLRASDDRNTTKNCSIFDPWLQEAAGQRCRAAAGQGRSVSSRRRWNWARG
ncbi:MAG: hypothetical protein PGN16_19760 [Sphingomonas phyllosphaerae]|uniref:hypothetical protein n=1 Tax=Sphingomonas phyllosphaerae TaxID=257003 RepID=UPI002FFBCA8D